MIDAWWRIVFFFLYNFKAWANDSYTINNRKFWALDILFLEMLLSQSGNQKSVWQFIGSARIRRIKYPHIKKKIHLETVPQGALKNRIENM